jgi:hypothetical protein
VGEHAVVKDSGSAIARSGSSPPASGSTGCSPWSPAPPGVSRGPLLLGAEKEDDRRNVDFWWTAQIERCVHPFAGLICAVGSDRTAEGRGYSLAAASLRKNPWIK